MTSRIIPRAFVWKRLHSIAGLWLVIFLIGHLLTNAQAALFVGDDGRGFIRSANSLEELPFLPLLEIAILGMPILIHTIWGIQYLRTARYNSFRTDGSSPALPEYPRNQAYTWQRITAWLLVVGIVAHVIHMRFVERPLYAQEGSERYYFVRVQSDDGLYTLSKRLNVTLYNSQSIRQLKSDSNFQAHLSAISSDEERARVLIANQERMQREEWLATLERKPLRQGEVIAAAKDFGTAELLMLRDTFKMPIMLVLYTLLVLSACFHAFNGVWTFLIKWGISLTVHSQKLILRITTSLMIIVAFLGMAAVWGTYWINLKQ